MIMLYINVCMFVCVYIQQKFYEKEIAVVSEILIKLEKNSSETTPHKHAKLT